MLIILTILCPSAATVVAKLDPRRLFSENCRTINAAIVSICKRYGLTGADAEDMGQEIQLHIIADDYKRLGEFRQESSLTTFLYTVVNNIFLDQHRKQQGRWRHSETAERLGREALLLELYCYRDGHPLHEAIEILQTNHGIPLSVEELSSLFAEIPCRTNRPTSVGEVPLEIPDNDTLSDEKLHDARRNELRSRLELVVSEIEHSLTSDERLMLKMHFREDVPLTKIAALLDTTPYKAKKEIDRILLGFRERLMSKGINYYQAKELLEES